MPESKELFSEPGETVSKSQRRRDALELKSLARDLIAMGAPRLARVPLGQELRAAVDEARRIRSNVARKRQLQFVAKLLRRIDPEPIKQALEAIENEARQLTARQQRTEAWRDYLLESGDFAVSDLMHVRHSADAQVIRQHVRQARAEAARDKAPAAARALFRLLREMDEAAPLPPIQSNTP